MLIIYIKIFFYNYVVKFLIKKICVFVEYYMNIFFVFSFIFEVVWLKNNVIFLDIYEVFYGGYELIIVNLIKDDVG